MNEVLARDIRRELFVGEQSVSIREAIMQRSKGKITVYVLGGRQQKIVPPGKSSMNGLESKGIDLDSYMDLVDTIGLTLTSMDEEVDIGGVVVTYKTGEDGGFEYLSVKHNRDFTEIS